MLQSSLTRKLHDPSLRVMMMMTEKAVSGGNNYPSCGEFLISVSLFLSSTVLRSVQTAPELGFCRAVGSTLLHIQICVKHEIKYAVLYSKGTVFQYLK